MANALAHREETSRYAAEASLPSAQETALRLALEEARRLAAQSRLLALNAALEIADAGREACLAPEMHLLVEEAGQAEEAARAVESLLRQIEAGEALVTMPKAC